MSLSATRMHLMRFYCNISKNKNLNEHYKFIGLTSKNKSDPHKARYTPTSARWNDYVEPQNLITIWLRSFAKKIRKFMRAKFPLWKKTQKTFKIIAKHNYRTLQSLFSTSLSTNSHWKSVYSNFAHLFHFQSGVSCYSSLEAMQIEKFKF